MLLMPISYMGVAAVRATPIMFNFRRNYAKDVAPEIKNQINSLIKEKAALLGVTRRIQVKYAKEGDAGESYGNQIFPFACGIMINPNGMDASARGFVVAEQLARIKRNDQVKMPWLMSLITTVACVGLSILLGFIPAIVGLVIQIAASVGEIAGYSAFIRHSVLKVDKMALSVCTTAEKIGALNWLKGIQEGNKMRRNDPTIKPLKRFWRRLTITKRGDEIFKLIWSPPLERRIQGIAKSILA